LAVRRLIYPLVLIVVACIVAVLSLLFFNSARKASVTAEIPADKTSSSPIERDDPGAYLAHLEPIRVHVAEITRKNAAGDFAELSPEQRPDMSDTELAKMREAIKGAAQRDLAAMEQAFPTPEEHANAAFEFENKHATAAAFIHYRKAVELKPNLAEAHAGLGRTLQLMGHTKEAIEAYQAAVRLAPSRPGWLADLGLSLYTDGRFDAALEMYDKALQLKPDFARAYYSKAVVYWRKGDYNQAWQCVDKCRELGEEPPKTFTQKLARDSGREPSPGAADPETPEKLDTPGQP
jgi:tetratricopeptide (TPR) repeat protein